MLAYITASLDYSQDSYYMMQQVVAWLNLRKSSPESESSQQHTSSRSKYLVLFFAFHSTC